MNRSVDGKRGRQIKVDLPPYGKPARPGSQFKVQVATEFFKRAL